MFILIHQVAYKHSTLRMGLDTGVEALTIDSEPWICLCVCDSEVEPHVPCEKPSCAPLFPVLESH
jgi:hypothetical protein